MLGDVDDDDDDGDDDDDDGDGDDDDGDGDGAHLCKDIHMLTWWTVKPASLARTLFNFKLGLAHSLKVSWVRERWCHLIGCHRVNTNTQIHRIHKNTPYI